MSTVFFHIDLDAFFASVEILDNPKVKGKPLIIGHRGPRSVVSTCSYEARTYGVHSAQSMSEALRRCPKAVVVEPNFKRYSQKSKEVMSIISSFAPGFMQMSIDEAFLNYSNMEKIHGLAGKAARKLKEMIKAETGLTVSVGVAENRYLAKLASDYHKPDGLTIVPPERKEEFIDKVGLEKLWGIGESTLNLIYRKGLRNTKDIRSLEKENLVHLFSENLGNFLYSIVRGLDPGLFKGEAKSHSLSSERTFYPDVYSIDALDSFIFQMAQELSFRALDEHVVARNVGIKIRYSDFSTYSCQHTPSYALYSSSDIYKIASRLLKEKYNNSGVRLLGLVLGSTYKADEVEQMELFREKSEKERKLEKAILELSKSGVKIIKARSLDTEISDDKQ